MLLTDLKNFLRRRRYWAASLLSGVALALVWALPWFPNHFLCLDDGPVHADVLVVMGGGTPVRAQHAADLFLQGVAPKIVVTGAGDSADNLKTLLAAGVPADAIRLEPAAKSTRQNARLSLPILRSLGARRVLIVTTWYHSRRSVKCFRHYAPDIQFCSSPSYYGFSTSARQGTGLPRQIRYEYLKLAGYWLCYGISPF